MKKRLYKIWYRDIAPALRYILPFFLLLFFAGKLVPAILANQLWQTLAWAAVVVALFITIVKLPQS